MRERAQKRPELSSNPFFNDVDVDVQVCTYYSRDDLARPNCGPIT